MVGLQERFWGKVKRGDRSECWLWQGGVANGYGMFRIREGKVQSAHRTAYELGHGSIAEGQWVLHKCDVKLCCNPSHLYAGTARENLYDLQDPPEARMNDQGDDRTTVHYSAARKRTTPRGFSFHAGDDRLVDFIAEYLGTSRSEAVRSAVRAFATHLAYLDNRGR